MPMPERIEHPVIRWLVWGLIGACVAVVLRPALQREPEGRRPFCQMNLKMIGLAVAQYCQDYEQCLPPAQGWNGQAGLLDPYLRIATVWTCPQGPRGRPHYGYNDTRDGVARIALSKVAAPEETILCLDYNAPSVGFSVPSLAVLGDPEIGRHRNGLNCLFVDGHVKWLSAEVAAERHWWTRR